MRAAIDAMMKVASVLCLVVAGQQIAFAQTAAKETSAAVAPRTFGTAAYPPVARLGRVEGAVTLRLGISDTGVVQEVALIAGPSVLVESSRDNAKRWAFPAGPARSFVLTYVYDIDGFCDQSPPSTLTRIRAPYDVVKVTTCHEWLP